MVDASILVASIADALEARRAEIEYEARGGTILGPRMEARWKAEERVKSLLIDLVRDVMKEDSL